MVTADRTRRSPPALDAWYECVSAPTRAAETVLRALRDHGTALRPRRTDDAGNGVVVFATVTPEVVRRIRAAGGAGRVLALSTDASSLGDDGWALLRAGAADVVCWADAATSARSVGDRLRHWQAVDELVAGARVREFLVGDTPVWRAALREAVEIARFTDAPVLVTGESGTGKERVAQLIHELDPRPGTRRLVVLDCTTVVPQLAGSEFFGHDKGAFTGAATAREGAFELADGGTLFLDEVGELPVTLQAELLRVVQEGTFKRVGSNVWRRSRFRLVCATNRDLAAEQTRGTFRDDFFYRIAGCRLHLPSLRERADDIVPLYRHFFRQVHPDRDPPELEDAVRALLLRRPYPGNVRDLRALVLQIVQRHVGDGRITVGDVPERERPDAACSAPGWCPDLEAAVRRGVAQGATPEEIIAAVRGAVA